MTFSSALTSTAVVLLPGMMCDDRLFAFQTEQLRKDSQNAVKLHIPQLIYGNSMPELAQYLLAALPPSFCLCGLSMGGILAMEIVAQAPHRVERLALMDTNPLAETEEGVARRNRQIREVRAGKLRQVIAEEMKPHYLADSPNNQGHLNLCMDMAVSLGDNAFINQSMALRDRPDQTDTLRGVRCPTLLLHGSEDRLCPPERHHLMQEFIPHARLAEIDGAGHLPPLEAPMTTYKHLLDWLRY
jgi:pimeloyl-ACP methyl ester carboxylesterase